MKKHDLPKCQVPRAQHEERQNWHIEYGVVLKESVRDWTFSDYVNVLAAKPENKLMPMAHMYTDTPFGAANTVEKAGCVCFTSYYLLQKYDKNLEMSFLEWVDEVVEQGYRMWKFSKQPGTFSSPSVNIDEAKARFKGVVDLENCHTKEELTQKLGEPIGIGGSVFLLDNVISQLTGKEAVKETRLSLVSEIIYNLSNDFWVPLRVNNAIYRNDPAHQGGHYITLFGVKGENALVWDSDFGEVMVPFERLMKAAVANDGLIAAWDISPLTH